jgi:pilus assembly protein CpaE
MKDQPDNLTSILLPQARVALHVLDDQLLKAVEELKADWRFSRITFELHKGQVSSAISIYQTTESPELVIMETPTIDDSLTQQLEDLAQHCASHTSAVVIGPVNDVYLYRRLIQMGVSDYLVKPLSKNVLADVIARTLIEKFGNSESRLITFMGAKGGVGTSTLAQVTAQAVAKTLQQKTIILDAAGGSSYLTISLGLEPVTSLKETLRALLSTDQDAFHRMIQKVNERLSVLATGADLVLDDPLAAEGFEQILDRLMETYPVVILDLSNASSSIKRIAAARSHEIVIVSAPILPSLRSARSLMQEVKDIRGGEGKDIELVVNMTGQAKEFEVSKDDIQKTLGQDFLNISFDAKVFHYAEIQGKNILDVKGSEMMVQGLLDLVQKVISSDQAPLKLTEALKPASFLDRLVKTVKGS